MRLHCSKAAGQVAAGFVGLDSTAPLASARQRTARLWRRKEASADVGVRVRDLGEFKLRGCASRRIPAVADALPPFPPPQRPVRERGLSAVIADDSTLPARRNHTPPRGGGDRGRRPGEERRRADVRCAATTLTSRSSTSGMPPTQTDEGIRAAREIRARYPDRGARPLPARRTYLAVELLADKRAGSRLPAEGPRYRRREFSPPSPRRRGRVGVRPAGRRRARRPRPRRRPDQEAVTPRARGARADGRGPLEPGDRKRLFISPRAVEKHVTSIFTKLGLPAAPEDSRRVLAVSASSARSSNRLRRYIGVAVARRKPARRTQYPARGWANVIERRNTHINSGGRRCIAMSTAAQPSESRSSS